MDLTLLATLKERLTTATQFSDVLDYFLTHFGENPEFIKLGERTRDSFLEAVLEQVGAQLLGHPVKPRNLLLTRLPEHMFVHGTATLEGNLTTALYFEDIHTGLLAVLWSASPSETKLVRFSGRPLFDQWKRSAN
jgi:hypothetical protein